MNRTSLLAAAAMIAIASSGVIATAQNTPESPSGPAGAAGQTPMSMMFERFDTDGDGAVTRAEIDALRMQAFESADADGDGMLNAEELAAWQDARRAERAAARMRARLDRLDSDGDGLVSAEELAASGPPAAMFDRMDADGDGAITLAELNEARGKWRDRGAGRMGGKHGHGRAGHHGDRHGGGYKDQRGWGQGDRHAPWMDMVPWGRDGR